MKILVHHVYVGNTPTTVGHEGTRKTLHNARRLAAALRRRGFDTCITALVEEADGSQRCELVESVNLSEYLATARGEEIAELVTYFNS